MIDEPMLNQSNCNQCKEGGAQTDQDLTANWAEDFLQALELSLANLISPAQLHLLNRLLANASQLNPKNTLKPKTLPVKETVSANHFIAVAIKSVETDILNTAPAKEVAK